MKVEEKERGRERKKEKKKRINLLIAFIMNKKSKEGLNFNDCNRLKENPVRTKYDFSATSFFHLLKEKCIMDPQHKPAPSVWI